MASAIYMDLHVKLDPTPGLLHVLVNGDFNLHDFNSGMDCVCEPEADIIRASNEFIQLVVHNAYERRRA